MDNDHLPEDHLASARELMAQVASARELMAQVNLTGGGRLSWDVYLRCATTHALLDIAESLRRMGNITDGH